MVDTESRGFKIAVFIITAIIAAFALADIIYYSEIRSGNAIGNGEITTMMVLSIIIFIVTIILFIWAAFRLFINKQTRAEWTKSTKQSATEYLGSTEGGYTQAEIDQMRASAAESASKAQAQISRAGAYFSNQPQSSLQTEMLQANA